MPILSFIKKEWAKQKKQIKFKIKPSILNTPKLKKLDYNIF